MCQRWRLSESLRNTMQELTADGIRAVRSEPSSAGTDEPDGPATYSFRRPPCPTQAQALVNRERWQSRYAASTPLSPAISPSPADPPPAVQSSYQRLV